MISRRSFFKQLVGISAGLSLDVPAFEKGRVPYVQLGDIVSDIGTKRPGFIGGRSIRSIGAWDGIGYPVVISDGGFRGGKETWYDFDLCDFSREVPDRFWHDPANDKYPNVHTYVRVQRFGETISEAIVKLNFAGIQPLQTLA